MKDLLQFMGANPLLTAVLALVAYGAVAAISEAISSRKDKE
jgi:hypothetical protein